jgi:high-affinity iron transporter
MLTAAVLLTWMIVWMRRQAATMQKNLETDVRQAAAGRNSQRALFWLSFLVVGREGFELVLFLLAAQIATGVIQTMLGAVLGLAAAIALGWMLFVWT